VSAVEDCRVRGERGPDSSCPSPARRRGRRTPQSPECIADLAPYLRPRDIVCTAASAADGACPARNPPVECNSYTLQTPLCFFFFFFQDNRKVARRFIVKTIRSIIKNRKAGILGEEVTYTRRPRTARF
jgi:hypothetical protein